MSAGTFSAYVVCACIILLAGMWAITFVMQCLMTVMVWAGWLITGWSKLPQIIRRSASDGAPPPVPAALRVARD
ncbi:MAG: hypothetical protein J1E80_08210 [Desulfovibrionaceae bacterium]|nr:hypothetical protein [Desulfovibrionaceae bacterium]